MITNFIPTKLSFKDDFWHVEYLHDVNGIPTRSKFNDKDIKDPIKPRLEFEDCLRPFLGIAIDFCHNDRAFWASGEIDQITFKPDGSSYGITIWIQCRDEDTRLLLKDKTPYLTPEKLFNANYLKHVEPLVKEIELLAHNKGRQLELEFASNADQNP